jgi:archaellum biogenesis protein FlaJ (TadC family)
MILYNLDSYQILTLTYILMLALSAIFVIFIPRNLPEKITVFRKRLSQLPPVKNRGHVP